MNQKMKDEPTRRTQSPSAKTSSSITSPSSELDNNELQRMALPQTRWQNRKRLSEQLSSMCESKSKDIAWEKRRHQNLMQERRRNLSNNDLEGTLTDEDMKELKGCIELGFGFNEEKCQQLCNTLPALDLYFAVNRQLSTSPVSSPQSPRSSAAFIRRRSESFDIPKSDQVAWKIVSPGEDPRLVKTKLRHWAQAVACSLMQSH